MNNLRCPACTTELSRKELYIKGSVTCKQCSAGVHAECTNKKELSNYFKIRFSLFSVVVLVSVACFWDLQKSHASLAWLIAGGLGILGLVQIFYLNWCMFKMAKLSLKTNESK